MIKFPREPKFRSDEGAWITQGLFLELSYNDPKYVLYTLKDRDYEYNGTTYPSVKKLYMEIGDPTEYQFAMQCFGGWEHWRRMCESTTRLHPYIEAWREELQMKLRSDGIRGMISEAKSGNAKASQWLADKGFVEGEKRGRPSRASKQNEAKFKERMRKDHEADLERLKKLN